MCFRNSICRLNSRAVSRIVDRTRTTCGYKLQRRNFHRSRQLCNEEKTKNLNNTSTRSFPSFIVTAALTASLPLFCLDYIHKHPDKYDKAFFLKTGIPSSVVDFLLSESSLLALRNIRSALGLEVDAYGQATSGISGQSEECELAHLKPQEAVVSSNSDNALFIVISLSDDSNQVECASALAQKVLDACETQLESFDVAIGFGQGIWNQVFTQIPGGAGIPNFEYTERSCSNGILPATGGDIFLHIKGKHVSDCFEFGKTIAETLPEHSVRSFDQTHGFRYLNRSGSSCEETDSIDTYDWIGCKINVANAKQREERRLCATMPSTGGSFALVQKWHHDLDAYRGMSKEERECVFGKTEDGAKYVGKINLNKYPDFVQKAIASGLPRESHVARVIGLNPDCSKLEIVRQSLPYGNASPNIFIKNSRFGIFSSSYSVEQADVGLSFVAYSKDPMIFNYMLDRMTGKRIIRGHSSNSSESECTDSILQYSECLTGQFFYVPSLQQLNALATLKI